MPILITGCAGFIGYHLAKTRLESGDTVIGLDNLNDYYDVVLKELRLQQLTSFTNFIFYHEDILNYDELTELFQHHQPSCVIHLAAQAGVRYSMENPIRYAQSNLLGFAHLLELCHLFSVEHFIYASSSSVYGGNQDLPYQEIQMVDQPLSVYAATKKSNELMAHAYSHLYGMHTTGLRFFTVYGPWGRPDMAFFKFTEAILKGEAIAVYNHGEMYRDFTYIDDVVAGINAVINRACEDYVYYRVFNIAYGNSVSLMDYVRAIESATGMRANVKFLPMQPGDVHATHADTRLFRETYNWAPRVSVDEGIARFVDWYCFYRGDTKTHRGPF